MATSSDAAGPEWAYLAPFTTNTGELTDLDALFVNVYIERKKPKPSTETKVLNLQTLISRRGHLYGPHDVTRFSYSRFRDLTETWDLDLFFYEGARKQGVAIPDEAAFQRLLLAVRHLGLGAPPSPTGRVYAPPVMKFFALPKPPPKLNPLYWGLILIGCVTLVLMLRQFGPGPVVVWSLVAIWVADGMYNKVKKDTKKTPTQGAPARGARTPR